MIIEEQDFRLIPVSESSLRYDLELLHTVRPKGKPERQEFKLEAYGLTLEQAIKKIARYRVSMNYKDEAIQISTYFKELKNELQSLKELCNV